MSMIKKKETSIIDLNIAQRVKGMRQSQGISQEELAERADLSGRQIRYIESGQKIGIKSLKKISHYFNISIDELIGKRNSVEFRILKGDYNNVAEEEIIRSLYYQKQKIIENEANEIWIGTPTIATPLTITITDEDYIQKEIILPYWQESFNSRVLSLRKNIMQKNVKVNSMFFIDLTLKRFQVKAKLHSIDILKSLYKTGQIELKYLLSDEMDDFDKKLFSFAISFSNKDIYIMRASQIMQVNQIGYDIFFGLNKELENFINLFRFYWEKAKKITPNELLKKMYK